MTTETKVSHTPGPWGLRYNEDGTLEMGGSMGGTGTAVFSESGFGSVAFVTYKKTNILGDSKTLQQKTFEANAKLIAAAPTLLSSIKLLVDRVKEAHIDADGLVNDCPVCNAIALAEHSIKKATL